MRTIYSKANIQIESIKETSIQMNTHISLLLILKGQIELTRNWTTIVLKPGDLFILNKGDLVGVSKSQGNLSLKYVMLREDELQPQFILNQALSSFYQRKAYNHLRNSMVGMYLESVNQTKDASYLIAAEEYKIIGYMHRYLSQKEGVTSSYLSIEVSEKIDQIVRYLHENYQMKLSLDTLSETFFSSKYYLSHMFKEQVGMTIGDYLKELRLSQATRLLVSTDDKVIDIALNVGFPNARSFNKAFQKKYDCTPAQFRSTHLTQTTESQRAIGLDQEVYELLSPHIVEKESMENEYVQTKMIDLSQTLLTYDKPQYLLKVNHYKLLELIEARQTLGTKWVSIDHIVKKLKINNLENRDWEIDYKELDEILEVIITANMRPYFHIQSIDFDDWVVARGEVDASFEELIKKLQRHLLQNYEGCQRWVFEFRCFYENVDRRILCKPMIAAVSSFSLSDHLVIYLPSVLDEGETLSNSSSNVYSIDDFTVVRPISFNRAIRSLQDEENKEHSNLMKQKMMTERFLNIKKDEEYRFYGELIQACMGLWFKMKHLQSYSPNHTNVFPITLGSKKPFHYFPEQLAEQLSHKTTDGRYTGKWYAHLFFNRLFTEIVYQDDICIVTKHGDFYRILLIYPGDGFVRSSIEKSMNTLTSTFIKNKFSLIKTGLHLTNLYGTYRIIKQELSKNHIEQLEGIKQLRNCSKLSYEDITYWNAIYRPSRSIQTVDINGEFHLDVAMELYGMVMIDLEKV